jgi:addiction module HigA family antidote
MTIHREQIENADWSSASTGERLAAVHPGEVLAEDFLKPLGLSQYRLAKDIGVPALRISQIVRGRRAVTADTALRLARYFGGQAEWWLRLQVQYDVEMARRGYGAKLEQEVTPMSWRNDPARRAA